MKKKNGGYTLAELIIVIAIISVLASLAFMGIGSIMGLKASGCAKKIVGYMNDAKTENASFDEMTVELSYDATEGYKATLAQLVYIFADDTTSVEGATLSRTSASENIVGDKVLTVKVKIGANEYDLKNYTVTIGFDSGSGSFKPITLKQGVTTVFSASDRKYVESIAVTQGSRTVTIKCDRLTGKFYIE